MHTVQFIERAVERIRRRTKIRLQLQYVLDILLDTLRGRLYQILIERKTAYAQTIVHIEMLGEVLRASLHYILERQMVGERVHMRQ